MVECAEVLDFALGIALPGQPARRRWALGGSRASAAGEEGGLAGVGKDDRHGGEGVSNAWMRGDGLMEARRWARPLIAASTLANKAHETEPSGQLEAVMHG